MASNGVRHRPTRETINDTKALNIDQYDTKVDKRKFQHLSDKLLYAVICFYFALYYIHVTLESRLPTPITLADAPKNPGRFNAERAMNHLKRLTDIGPRVAASYENEVLAVKILKQDIYEIINIAKSIHNIEVDVQKVTGSYPLTFLEGLTNYYRNVQNVIVKFGPKPFSKHSIMINCHFDTVMDSPGGSDDGASCAIMMEIFRTIVTSDQPLQHNIILLFNGAEENLMHASHGFITQHKWAKEIGAFINLEACGAGGREVLFQSGPNSPWLMKTYASNVAYPFASSVAQEVFETGIIPGDTDYRVFRDFGNVSGLDFAWASNGYVYHTKYDNIDQIPLGTLQRTGDNILGVATAMANAEELKDVQKHKPGNMVYFDLLGAIVVRYPDWFGLALNVFTIFLSVYTLNKSKNDAQSQGISNKLYKSEMLRTQFIQISSCLANFVVIIIISGFVSLVGRSMSWYAKPIWIFFLYVLPTIITPMFIQYNFSKAQLSIVKSKNVLFQMYHDAYQISWSFILLLAVLLGARSGFIPWLWVFCPVLGNALRKVLFKDLTVGSWKWLFIYIATLFLPVMQSINMIEGCLSLFIPIMGRVGSDKNPDIIISLFVAVMFGLLFSYSLSLILIVVNPKRVISSLSIVFLVSLLLLLFTPLGFPYTADTVRPKPQRYMILHTQRTFHNRLGEVVNNESGYWVVDHDYNSPGTVMDLVPEMQSARPVGDDCENYLYCGMPYLMPIVGLISKTHWIPTGSPNIPMDTTMKVLENKIVSKGIKRIKLEITGPDHMGLFISPRKGVTFNSWNLNDENPVSGKPWKDQETWFIYYACHADPEPWVVSIDFNVPDNSKDPIIDIALTSQFLHGHHQHNLPFKKFLAQFPPWTVPVGWTATYKSWIL